MAITTHLHRRHRGLIPADQLASGTSTAGHVPVADGAGSQVWTAPGDATAHIADTTDAHDASAISFVPAGTIAATNVQAAIEEVASEGGGGGGGWVTVGTDATRLETGRQTIYDENQEANIWMDDSIEVFSGSGAASYIALYPDTTGYVAVEDGVGLILPALAADPTAVRDGHVYYNTATDVARLRANGAWTSLGAATTAFRGCVAVSNSTTTMTTGTTEYAIALAGTDEIDTDAIHDPASNNTRLTCPAALNGYYFRAIGHCYVPVTQGIGNWLDLKIRKGGAAGTVLGQVRQASEGNPIVEVSTRVFTMATSDYIELYAMSNVAGRTADADLSWVSLEVVGSP